MTGRHDDGLRPLLRQRLPDWDWLPVEMSIISGVPDMNGCRQGVEVWVECKSTTTGALKFRPLQPSWISRRARHGGRVWVAARWRHYGGPRLGPPRDDLWLVHGRHVVPLVTHGLAALPAAVPRYTWTGGPSRWAWDEISSVLTEEFCCVVPREGV